MLQRRSPLLEVGCWLPLMKIIIHTISYYIVYQYNNDVIYQIRCDQEETLRQKGVFTVPRKKKVGQKLAYDLDHTSCLG